MIRSSLSVYGRQAVSKMKREMGFTFYLTRFTHL